MTIKEYNKTVDLFADGVFRFILKNLGDSESANDIVQEAFVRMWDKHNAVEFEKAKTYLFTSAYHIMIDMIRKEKNKKKYSEIAGHERFVNNDFSDLSEILGRAVARLPEIQRTVVMLRDYEGYSYEEIGNITNLNESQVKVYIYRARKTLKQYIGSMDVVI
ncbi:MAG: RNA polymerase sigma factor [Bacteroidales bacterium]|nr:RNA polymerase sigma factor [Bacteroidales bacterium]